MRVQVAGRHMDVGEALRTRITDELSAGVAKYFNRATDAMVTVEKSGPGYDVDCVVHLASGITLEVGGKGGDAHVAFGDALGKMEKRIRRYKSRLRDHHNNHKSPLPAEDAPAYVLARFQDEDEGDSEDAAATVADTAPLVIAETKAAVRTMPVAMAVMQLELTEAPALMFRNAAHGGLNMVFRRDDGNIGWVDPGVPAKANGGVNGG
ncbi:MAG: ribosome-associated translation inhibitor RaiA [Alphaproteobacteria bacterium]|nr:ribosome-associated translation inhibitor RaiA [Alphaproteobacteria bacterium]